MVFRQMFTKGFGPSIFDTEEDVPKSKKFLGKQYLTSESDVLNEKEKQLRYEKLRAGDYQLSISARFGKFKLRLRVHNKLEDFISVETKLSAGKKHSKYECTFHIEEEDAPVVLSVFLRDKGSFFRKRARYDFRLERISSPWNYSNPTTPHTPTPTLQKENSVDSLLASNQKLTVKICVGDSIRFLTLTPQTTYSELKEKLIDYGDLHVLKYEDIEGQLISIQNQEDLDNFFEYRDKSAIPKIYLYNDSESGSSNTSTLSNSYPDFTPVSPVPPVGPRRRANTTTQQSNKSPVPVSATTTRKWQKGYLLGAGNFGKVYLGMNNDDGTLMAVKEIELSSNAYAQNSAQLEALQQEITLMSQLSHEHIVRYLGMEKTDNKIYIFLDFIPGGSLEAVLGTFSLPENVVRLYTLQILQGLEYLHKNKIIHRDIKAANVLLDDVGNVYLADFGCSKRLKRELSMDIHSLSGTPNYMSPEVVKTGNYTEKSDIWSLGCTVLEMVTGKPPWYHMLTRFDNVFAFFSWLMENTNWDLESSIPENISRNCKDFITQCLKMDVNNRPSASELLKHPFIVNTEDIATSSVAKPIKDASDDEDESDSDDFDELQSDVETEDSDNDSITREILAQHSVISISDTESESESPLPLPSASKLKESTSNRKSMILRSSTGKSSHPSSEHRTLAMHLLNDARTKRNSIHIPDGSTAEIQRFLQQNAISQTTRMLSTLEEQHQRFQRFVIRKNQGGES